LRRAVIEVERLTKRYGQLMAVDCISLKVFEGEVFSLLGPNGAGKTTTVEILEGLRPPTSGEAYVLGHDVRDPGQLKALKRRIGVLPQAFEAFERLTVLENLKLIAAAYGASQDLRPLLENWGLWEFRNTLYDKLSGGLKRRLGIAMALVGEPELVFLDEPTSGLDPYARREVWRLVGELRGKGKTVFLTTHYIEEAERLSDRVCIMNRGRIAALGKVEELIAAQGLGSRLVIRGLSPEQEAALEGLGSRPIRLEDGSLLLSGLTLQRAAAALALLQELGFRGTAEVTQGSLEEAFLRIVGHRLTEAGELA